MFALVGCDDQTTTVMTYPVMSYLSFSGSIIHEANEQLDQEEDVYYIYYYGDNCSACTNIKNEALYTIEFLNEDSVYFVKLYTSSDIHEDISIEGTPSLVRIVNGEVDEVFKGGQKVIDALHDLS